ncbi:MAG: hydroxyacylglutathione hydrolase [Gammaproteobacteria bacterium RBG_16_57_12]|nr:MAG: hydroxyacylglutathione hydrolase [Gammaproteobacteria bacterium RBG_16_57_12]
MLSITGIPAFTDNYIWMITSSGSGFAAIVDPGDAQVVLQRLSQQSLQPVAILITHHHRDHIGGIREILSHYQVPVYGPAREHINGISHAVTEGDQITIPELGASFRVIDTPGHTRGHVCYHGHSLLFCGDTLFTAGCGRLFEGTAAQMQDSLHRLRQLPDDTQVYCAHEYTQANLAFARIALPDNPDIRRRQEDVIRKRRTGLSTVPANLGLEKRTNPFLRWDDPVLIRRAEEFTATRLEAPAEIFSVIRHWKDTLD